MSANEENIPDQMVAAAAAILADRFELSLGLARSVAKELLEAALRASAEGYEQKQ